MTVLGGINSGTNLVQADVTATLDGWTNLNLASGVSAVATGTYGVPGYYIDPFGFVHFRGVVAKNVASWTNVADNGSVPIPMGPGSGTIGPKEVICTTHRLAAPISWARVDITAAGAVVLAAVGTAAENNSGVSLAGVRYRTNLPTTRAFGTLSSAATLDSEFDFTHMPWQGPSFQNSWRNFASGYQEAGYCMTLDGTVHLAGLVIGGANNTTIFAMPDSFAPNYKRGIATNNTDNRGRVYIDVASAGTSKVIATDPFDAAAGSAFVCLDGLSYIP